MNPMQVLFILEYRIGMARIVLQPTTPTAEIDAIYLSLGRLLTSVDQNLPRGATHAEIINSLLALTFKGSIDDKGAVQGALAWLTGKNDQHIPCPV